VKSKKQALSGLFRLVSLESLGEPLSCEQVSIPSGTDVILLRGADFAHALMSAIYVYFTCFTRLVNTNGIVPNEYKSAPLHNL
jgi:hypothetical protein